MKTHPCYQKTKHPKNIIQPQQEVIYILQCKSKTFTDFQESYLIHVELLQQNQLHFSTSFTSVSLTHIQAIYIFSARSCYCCHYHVLPVMLNLTRQRSEIIVFHYSILNTNKPLSQLLTVVNHCKCTESTCSICICFPTALVTTDCIFIILKYRQLFR